MGIRANTREDIEEIKKNQEEIYEGIRKILTSLSKIE